MLLLVYSINNIIGVVTCPGIFPTIFTIPLKSRETSRRELAECAPSLGDDTVTKGQNVGNGSKEISDNIGNPPN
jgi:hypothetical protein